MNMEKKKTKIACLIPNNYEVMDREFVINIFSVVCSFYSWNQNIGNKYELNIFVAKEGFIDMMRESLAITALRWQADYLLWMDSDQLFPHDLIRQMVETFEREKGIEAVSGLYTFKNPPFLPHCYREYNKETDKFSLLAGFPLDQTFAVQGCGFGIVMFKSSVFKKVTRPFFEFKPGCYGEDLYFCRKFILENKRPIRLLVNPKIVSQHMTKITVDIHSYIGQNKIKVEHDVLRPTPDQVKLISDFQEKLMNNFLKSPLAPEKEKKLDKKKKPRNTIDKHGIKNS